MGIVKFNEPFRPVLLNLSLKLIEQLDTQANSLGWTRSDVVRQVLHQGLLANPLQPMQRHWVEALEDVRPRKMFELDGLSTAECRPIQPLPRRHCLGHRGSHKSNSAATDLLKGIRHSIPRDRLLRFPSAPMQGLFAYLWCATSSSFNCCSTSPRRTSVGITFGGSF